MTKKKHAYHHGDLRASLIEHAIAELDRCPTKELSLRNLGRLTGVSAPAFYDHFEDKEAFWDAIAAEGFAELADAMKRATLTGDPSADLEERLKQLATAHITFGLERPGLCRIMSERDPRIGFVTATGPHDLPTNGW